MTLTTARAAVTTAYDRIDDAARPELWITLRDRQTALDLADAIDARAGAGEDLRLRGTTVAVKDNIDVAGLPTTAGTPRVLREPTASAATVASLEAAGAVVIGKTTMDQFATGLVGTRTPYGAPASAFDPERISGGSSSGSAVAVALGLVDVALGTDTAGSGRVPAAFNHLVGIKPTLGLLSPDGVYPASPSYDTASVFARDLPTASGAMQVMTRDGSTRPWTASARLAPMTGRIAVARDEDLQTVVPAWREAYRATVGAIRDAGFETVEIDVSPLLATAKLLYGGALLAERAASFADDIVTLGSDADPVVASIVLPAADFAAVDLVRDQQSLVAARAGAAALFEQFDALLLPTAPGHPTLADVAAEPVSVNAWLGTFTNFVNLLDLSALAIPAVGSTPAAGIGVSLVGAAFDDLLLARIAGQAGLADTAPVDELWGAPTVALAVFGAHRSGQPLEHELRSVGAGLLGEVETIPEYRMVRLATTPPKPGVFRSADGVGRSIRGELWALTPTAFARFVQGIAAPMAIGRVLLDDGRDVLGFTCEPGAVADAEDVSEFGDWVGYLASLR
jgi:allophanate hydrolase